MNTIRLLAGCLLVLLSLSINGTAADWPQWRGPNRDGVSTETGLLQQWPAGGPPLLWEATGLGKGYSTVSVADNRIYTTGQKSDSSFVVALRAADGKPVWSANLGKPTEFGGYVGPRSAPTVAGTLLFALDPSGELVCLETATGAEKWRKHLARDFGGQPPGWGFSEAPLVDGDRVVITPGGTNGAVVALNQQTGALLWQCKEFTDAAHYSSLIPAEIGGVRQYIQLTAASVVGIAANDGKLLWHAPRHGETAVIPTPIYADNLVYVASGYGIGCNLFKITASGNNFSAAQVYANKAMANVHGGVIKVGDFDYGYSDGKGWTCQNFKTGEVKWQARDKLGKGCLAFADGRFYLRQENGPGTVALIEASPDGYKEHGRFNPLHRSPENSWPHPVIANGKLYLRDQDVLQCYNIKAR